MENSDGQPPEKQVDPANAEDFFSQGPSVRPARKEPVEEELLTPEQIEARNEATRSEAFFEGGWAATADKSPIERERRDAAQNTVGGYQFDLEPNAASSSHPGNDTGGSDFLHGRDPLSTREPAPREPRPADTGDAPNPRQSGANLRAGYDDFNKGDKPRKSRQSAAEISSVRNLQNRESAGDSDDDDDEESGAVSGTTRSELNSFVPMAAWFWQQYFGIARDILYNPRQFFAEMPQAGGYIPPVIFLGLSALIYSLLQAIGSGNLLVLFSSFIVSLLSTAVGAVVCALLFQRMQGKGTIEGTFRVFAYSKVTLLFSWISVGQFPIGGLAAIFYTVYLNVLGVEQVQKMPVKQIATVLIIMAVIERAFKFRFGI